ncbi:YggS family pyridoxal phosphate-dependent enzyme [Hazenella sp. IB182357]|uniref:Pyridoxal phosphate homeostasis protein n=1 Tax=Polycladospora coralii TaxID=2771432 RepID=A0A926N5W9_9BACL|nr:YggS family pyridoxal phosphate-dependent enzyme [Polycladospora coralii]MBD1371336.1 YggS family pyridoxal phosphate-dependent enzyme [Polycladospora coralii]MBS7530304.1 YggS family pyridoxal phosphate-dependent enzyme [Polycladospora coralii]
MDSKKHRWGSIQEKIKAACKRANRDVSEVNVLAVTKYIDEVATREVLDLGINHIGESRIQDAVKKWEQIQRDATWHFIGHLQRNKVKEVIARFHYLHALDRFTLAQEINRRTQEAAVEPLKCFIQVNVSGEESKYGITPQELEEFAREVANLSHIEIIGLMTMAPIVPDAEEVRPLFRELRRLKEHLQNLNQPRLNVSHLSMGMSQDYGVAIEEGATWIRLGTELVGPGRRGS